MFGEESMYGQKEVSIDEKGRMLLPAYTKREKGDKLFLIYDEDICLYQIFNFSTYDDIVNKLQNNYLNANNKMDEIYYKKRICEVSKSIISSLKVDSQGRVKIGKIYGQNKVLCIGSCDHVILHPTKNSNTNIRKF